MTRPRGPSSSAAPADGQLEAQVAARAQAEAQHEAQQERNGRALKRNRRSTRRSRPKSRRSSGRRRQPDGNPEHGLASTAFAQIDAIQDFKRVNPDWDATLRPSRIPTVDGQFGSDGQFIASVRQSRFGVKASGMVAGKPYEAKFEFDLFGTGVDAGQTTFRIRHAYGRWGRSSRARPTRCSWTATSSPTWSTTGARRAWCSSARRRSG
jgi:hypothetical protein